MAGTGDIDITVGEASSRRYEAGNWIRKMVGVVAARDLPAQPSVEDFRQGLRSGMILCKVLNKIQPGAIPKIVKAPSAVCTVPDEAAESAYFENVRKFLIAVEEIGLPTFDPYDLEEDGDLSRVVDCLLALKSYSDWKGGSASRKFSTSAKSSPSGKSFSRRNSEPSMGTISRTQSVGSDKSLDTMDQGGDASDVNDECDSAPLYTIVCDLLEDREQEDIPLIVENILNKVTEEFETRLREKTKKVSMVTAHMTRDSNGFASPRISSEVIEPSDKTVDDEKEETTLTTKKEENGNVDSDKAMKQQERSTREDDKAAEERERINREKELLALKEKARKEEEERAAKEEQERINREKELQEKARKEEERAAKEEQERINREKELQEKARKEEEERAAKEEQERIKREKELQEKARKEEEERAAKEEEERIKREKELQEKARKEEEERAAKEEQERINRERELQEKARREEEEKASKEEQERINRERELLALQEKAREEEERARKEKERIKQEKRLLKEKEKARKKEEAERARKERERIKKEKQLQRLQEKAKGREEKARIAREQARIQREKEILARKEKARLAKEQERIEREKELLELKEKLRKQEEDAREQERIRREKELLYQEERARKQEEYRKRMDVYHGLNAKTEKRQGLVGQQHEGLQELRGTISTAKTNIKSMQNECQEEADNLGKHVNQLCQAAAGYNKVLEENRKLYNQVQDLKGSIRVYCRVRPFLPGQENRPTSVDYMDHETVTIIVPSKSGREGRKASMFNKVFGPSATQEEVFSDTQPLIRSVLDGYNVCIFAYGQTGAGKTYTMTGPKDITPETMGVNYRALNDLFLISEERKNLMAYEISINMLEIYNDEIRDLLVTDGTTKIVDIRSGKKGINVPEANLVPVTSTDELKDLMNLSEKNRAVRSHSFLTVHVFGKDLTAGTTTRGCMHLVDLAGSERLDESNATDDVLDEATHINKSLSALGDVLVALALKSKNVPYKTCKLTQFLQDALGGQAKILMFVHLHPDADEAGETLNTLKFTERYSTVEGGAGKSPEVRELKEQIAYLKAVLAKKESGDVQVQELTVSSPRGGKQNDGLEEEPAPVEEPSNSAPSKLKTASPKQPAAKAPAAKKPAAAAKSGKPQTPVKKKGK